MLASRRRENPSRGRHRGRRQHRPSRVLRDLLGPGDPAYASAAPTSPPPTWRPCCCAVAMEPQLYDQQAEHSRHLTLLPAGTVINLPFITPPTTALLALPFTVLDPGTAFRVWSLVELLLLALAVWIAIRAGPWPSASWAGAAGRHVARGGRRGRNLRIPPPRSDRRHRRARARGRVRGLADRSTSRRRILAGARFRGDQAPPGDRARHLAHRPTRLACARAVRRPAVRVVAAVSLALVGPSGTRRLRFGIGLRGRQHARVRARSGSPGWSRPGSGGGAHPDGHRTRRIADRARRMRRARGALARTARCARGFARRRGGALAGRVAAPPAPRPRHPRAGIRVVRGPRRGGGDRPVARARVRSG